MPNTNLSIDSSGDNLAGADFTKTAAAGFRLAEVRAGVAGWIDPSYAPAFEKIGAAGMLRGAYHFLCFDRPIEPQIDAMARAVGDLDHEDGPVPAIDVEFPTHRAATISAEACADMIVAAALRTKTLLGAKPRVYSSNRVEHEELLNALAKRSELTGCPFWVSHYGPYVYNLPQQPTPTYDPPTPDPWGTGSWWQHQFQGNVVGTPGIRPGGKTDISRFHPCARGENTRRVALVQLWLNAAMRVSGGMPLPPLAVDGGTPGGGFGAQTEARVKLYQAAEGLSAAAGPGVVDLETFCRMTWIP